MKHNNLLQKRDQKDRTPQNMNSLVAGNQGPSSEDMALTTRETRFKKKAMTCSICYNPIDLQGKLETCTHEFCFPCIQKWSMQENSCPMCKRRFNKIKKVWKRVNYSDIDRKRAKLDIEDENVRVLDKTQIAQPQMPLVVLLEEIQHVNEMMHQPVPSLSMINARLRHLLQFINNFIDPSTHAPAMTMNNNTINNNNNNGHDNASQSLAAPNTNTQMMAN